MAEHSYYSEMDHASGVKITLERGAWKRLEEIKQWLHDCERPGKYCFLNVGPQTIVVFDNPDIAFEFKMQFG